MSSKTGEAGCVQRRWTRPGEEGSAISNYENRQELYAEGAALMC
jgi:hypothetical protein